MKLLTAFIGGALSSLVVDSTTEDDQPRCHAPQRDDRSSPTILWAAELVGGTKIVLVDEHPRRLIEVRSFVDRSETYGNVAIAKRLEALGILREENAEAKRALPGEISDEFAQEGKRTRSPRGPEQLSLFARSG